MTIITIIVVMTIVAVVGHGWDGGRGVKGHGVTGTTGLREETSSVKATTLGFREVDRGFDAGCSEDDDGQVDGQVGVLGAETK